MSGPGGYTDWTKLYGAGSPYFQQELDSFNAVRDAAIARMAAGRAPGMAGDMQQAGAVQQAQPVQPVTSMWHDEDLVGAATFWGIPEQVARSMPRDQLIDVVNQYRGSARQGQDATVAGRAGSVGAMLASLPAMFGVGAGEAITGGLKNLPLIGDALAHTQLVHDADLKLRQMEEGIRASTPESFQWVNTGQNVAGNLAALWYPASGAWAVAGKVGKVVPLVSRASPIGRAAFQGGLSSYLLEGGGDSFHEHPLLMVGGGAALGAAAKAAEPLLEALATRITKSFVSPAMLQTTGRIGPEVGPQGLGPQQGPMVGVDDVGPIGVGGYGPGSHQGPMVGVDRSHTQVLEELAAGGDEQAKFMLAQINQAPAATIQTPAAVPTVTPEILEAASRGDPNATAALQASTQSGLQRVAAIGERLDSAVSGAENLAAQMNKAATIVQSPDMPAMAGETMLDETTVARAAQASNPGGINVIQGVLDPAPFAQGTSRFAVRNGRLDVITGDVPLQEHAAWEYEHHGVFTGQRVHTSDGFVGEIKAISPKGEALIQPYFHEPEIILRRPVSDLHPWMSTPGSTEAPSLWDAFDAYATQRAGEAQQAMGGALSPEQLSTIKNKNLATWLEDFLDATGISNLSDRARTREYFNLRWVEGFKAQAPREVAAQGDAVQALDRVVGEHPLPAVQQLDQHAATKGFVAVPTSETSWTLRDAVGSTATGAVRPEISFTSREAAETWVKQLNRELPDVTPPADVPLEVQARHPTEPTQGPNLNEATPTKVAESIHEITTDQGEPPVEPPEIHVASGNLGRLKNAWTDGFLRWRPARRVFSAIDQALVEAGAPTGIAGDYDKMSSRLVQHHNDMHPWMDELTDILRPVGTQHLRDGTWYRIYEIEDPAERLAAAKRAGFSPAEIATHDKFENLMQRLFPETGLDEIRQIPRYISHIAKRQSVAETIGKAWDDFPLTKTTQPFYEYARTGNLNAREMDPRVLGETYIRSVFWQKNMAQPFNELVTKWKGLAETEALAPAANVMENWLKIIRYGYHAEDDIALDVMHGALRAVLGPEITRQQARELFNMGLNTTHSGLLGFRLHVMARDALQLFFAIPRAGDDLLRVMSRAATGGAEARAAIWREALADGAIALQTPRMTAPGTFGGALETAATMAPGEGAGVRMRTLGKVTAAVRDLMPDMLKDTRDTALHPMYFYGKQQEWMRAMVYMAGKEKGTRALAIFRKTGDLEALMGESAARTFDPAWQRQFKDLVAAGMDEDAAKFLGRQLADATQFKYGVAETPYAAKSTTGRVALQFGSFAIQYGQFLRESLVNGTVADKVKFLATAGAVTAGLEAASRESGWNFRLMNPFFALGFTGGPWIGLMTSIASGANSLMQQTQGRETSAGPISQAANSLGQAASILNPLGGLVQGAQAAGLAAQSPNPLETFGQYLVTGERTLNPAVNRAEMAGAQQMFQQSLQPQALPSSPMRAQAQGLTQVPQQQVADPTGIIQQSSRDLDSASGPVAGFDRVPTAGELRSLGVSDPSRVYFKGGRLVYDSQIVGPDGHVATHDLSQAKNLLKPGETWEQYENAVISKTIKSQPIVRDVSQLDDDTQMRVRALQQAAQQAGIQLTVGETVRAQQRQEQLFQQGRGHPGQIATWTLTSNHAQGRAVDFIVNGDQTGQDPGYLWLWQAADAIGLVPMREMDPGHLALTDSSARAIPQEQVRYRLNHVARR